MVEIRVAPLTSSYPLAKYLLPIPMISCAASCSGLEVSVPKERMLPLHSEVYNAIIVIIVLNIIAIFHESRRINKRKSGLLKQIVGEENHPINIY